MYSLKDSTIRELERGEDSGARAELNIYLLNLRERSNSGEIGIGDYISELQDILQTAIEYEKLFKD